MDGMDGMDWMDWVDGMGWTEWMGGVWGEDGSLRGRVGIPLAGEPE